MVLRLVLEWPAMSEPAARRRRAAWRVEWYRYGDSNPGPVAENHVS
jgi:hypothetical protein